MEITVIDTNNIYNRDNSTKKNRDKLPKNKDIKKLWNLFDEEFDNNKSEKLECIYRTPQNSNSNNTILNEFINNEICSSCKNQLFLGDDGFLVCPNKKCGIQSNY